VLRSVAVRSRALLALVLGIAIGTAIGISPASGHVGDSVTHLVDHLENHFFTKSESNARFVKKVDAAWHVVGAPGEPTFGDCGDPSPISNYNATEWNTVGFFKDANGVVHLRGAATSNSGVSSNCSTIFFLPEGYRPPRIGFFPVVKYDSTLFNLTPFSLTILPDGRIFAGNLVWSAGEVVSLEGVSFRAAR
jgi:hypothetical protein